MWIRASACALIGSLFFACGGRIDLRGSPGSTSDAGAIPEGGSSVEASGGPGAAACPIDGGHAVVAGACTPVPTQAPWPGQPLCDSASYEVVCSGSEPPSMPANIPTPVGCSAIPIPTPSNESFYCCPCEGAEVPSGGLGGACVTIDLSAYDRSCVTDSDCTAVAEGSHCNFGCEGACPNAAINVRGRARYEQALPRPYPLGPTPFCECGAIHAPDARCIDGQCAYCGGAGSCVSP